ncbi:ROK family protein [Acidihalobacter prosperus]|uniref:Fructokinase n=1 Tax=Acidihalobacter prosperus TaxID=160660 RepID=A0A1A6C667_9GAMM|nr:ROK family protein [Acidihalobacter prosperus]OBS10056.1 hypothetical protein Thpro_021106 [Acidihalobacter prosperus]
MWRLGVDLGGTKIEVAVLDPDGHECLRRRVPTPQGDYAGTVEVVGELVESAEQALGVRCTVGVGTPGAISPASGLIKNANSTCLNGRALGEDLACRLGREVRLANDANCLALSETADGAAAGAASVFAVILGTGAGGGIVVGGRLLTGANAIAGEWGHNPLPWPRDEERPGPACYCGRRGCLETFVSGPGLARDHAAVTGVGLDAPAVVQQAAAGDRTAQATLDRHADRLARGLAMVINVLDPEVIVLAGGLSNLPGLCAAVSGRWGRYVFSDRVDTRLTTARHGDSSGVRGAARLWTD